MSCTPPPFDDVAACLEKLASYPMALVTNASAQQQADKAVAIGIDDRMAFVQTPDSAGVAKPEPEAFHMACERLGYPPASVVYVGDHLQVDAIGSRDAGMPSVWLDRPRSGGAPADITTIHSLRELPGLLG